MFVFRLRASAMSWWNLCGECGANVNFFHIRPPFDALGMPMLFAKPLFRADKGKKLNVLLIC